LGFALNWGGFRILFYFHKIEEFVKFTALKIQNLLKTQLLAK